MSVTLQERLDRIADKVVKNSRYASKQKKDLGSLSIVKNDSMLFDIVSPNQKILFENISMYDVAVIIAKRYNLGNVTVLNEVLYLENQYSKHYTDMTHYLNCLKGAKKSNDKIRMAILEDKFSMAEQTARYLRNKIETFK